MDLGILVSLYVLWGAVVGLMVGFTAIGTGLLGTPGLILFFGLEPVTAVGTMGLAGVTMMASSVLHHYRDRNIEWRVAAIFSATAIPTSYFAARYADQINAVVPLTSIIGVVVLSSMALLFYRYVIMKPKPRELDLSPWKLIASPFIGLLLGTLMGATSISGSIILISFLLVLKLPSPLAIGTSCAVAAVSLAVAATAHIGEAHVDWVAFGGLVPGVIAGSTVGSRLVNRVPREILRYAILVILGVAGVMIFL